MSDSFNRKEVIDLAERIYVNRIRNNNTVNEQYTKNDAKMAFHEAMIFRTIEQEIFGADIPDIIEAPDLVNTGDKE